VWNTWFQPMLECPENPICVERNSHETN